MVDAVNRVVAATDKSMQALQNRDQVALSAAQSDALKAEAQIGTVLQTIAPYLQGSLP